MRRENKGYTYRKIGLDVLRVLGVFCIVCNHWIEMNGIYEKQFSNFIELCIATLVVWMGKLCLPIFMTLSGQLLYRKSFSMGSLFRVIKEYIICAVVTSVIMILWFGFNPKECIVKIVDFTIIPYAWYIEFYIGFYLLMPIFNSAFEKYSIFYVNCVLFIIAVLPATLNPFFRKFGFVSLIPSTWEGALYPFFYYSLGALLTEKKHNIQKTKYLCVIFICFLFLSIWSVLVSITHNNVLNRSFEFNTYDNIVIVIVVYCLFRFWENWDANKIWRKILLNLSDGALVAYLMSYVVEQLLYSKLVISMWWYLPLVFWGCYSCSVIILCINKGLIYFIGRFGHYICKKE